MELSTKEVLVKARELFADKPGKGTLKSPKTGCLCALGAIAVAEGRDLDKHNEAEARGVSNTDEDPAYVEYDIINPAAVAALAAVLHSQRVEPFNKVWWTNDGVQPSEMLAYFDKAIAAQ